MSSIYLFIDLLLRKTNLASSHFIWESETQGGGYQCSMGLPYTVYRFNLFLLQNCCCFYQKTKISKFHRTSKNYISKMICYLSLTWHLTVCRWVTGFCSTCSARTWTAWSSRRWCTSLRGGSDTRARTSTMRRLPRVMVSSSPLILI